MLIGAATGAVAGGALGCGIAATQDVDDTTPYAIGCPLDVVGGALIGGTVGYLLDEAADILAKHPGVTVDVSGYCDIIGGAAHKLRLSQLRADAVANYLEGKGIAASRLVTTVTARPISLRPMPHLRVALKTAAWN